MISKIGGSKKMPLLSNIKTLTRGDSIQILDNYPLHLIIGIIEFESKKVTILALDDINELKLSVLLDLDEGDGVDQSPHPRLIAESLGVSALQSGSGGVALVE